MAIILAMMMAFTLLPSEILAAPPLTMEQDIDSYIQSSMSAKDIPGLAVAIVQNNATIYMKGFGLASLNKQTRVSTETIFDLASCSKSFTALGVLLLYNAGLIELDKPLVDYIPDFRLKDANKSSQITVRELLMQTSGIPGVSTEPLAFSQGPNAYEQVLQSITKITTDRPPGSSFEYANINYVLLGALIEKVSGETYENYMAEHVFKPLGMSHTTANPEIAAAEDRADGHQLLLGKVITRNTPIFRSMEPAGWVMSCADDMSRWLEFNLDDGILDGKQIVPASVIELMHTTGVQFVKNGEITGYGMGWFTGMTLDGEACIWHGGDTTNFLAETILLPRENLGVVLLVNGQTCEGAHDIASAVAGIVKGNSLTLPASPWWASWKSVDNMSKYGTALSLILIIGIVPYVWWQIRKGNRKKTGISTKSQRRIKIWHMMLPITPWAIVGIIAGVSYGSIQILFGFNIFRTIIRFGYFAPPGVIVAAAVFFLAISLWLLTISIMAILRPLISKR